ncbi:MAG: coproporphyrinogen III oxidase family protein [bacterium]|nr:coproporphyrinogen III oxidase family protein [bacterium]
MGKANLSYSTGLSDISNIIDNDPYRSYLYSYPHKTAYGPLEPVSLKKTWEQENRESLFLYMHIPFCTLRCGFCNLLSLSNPGDELPGQYIKSLKNQAETTSRLLQDRTFTRFALGGGTPTKLNKSELDEVFDIAEQTMGADLSAIPVSVEVSPDTITPSKLELLKSRNTNRISIGIQSFIDSENRAIYRNKESALSLRALDTIRTMDFPVLNIDLIYGLPGQTVNTWIYSLEKALKYKPEELYLYPLYIRSHTGLGRSDFLKGIGLEKNEIRMECYTAARDLLLSKGYRQESMRLFRSSDTGAVTVPEYSCQENGMIGLGCGARSYTSSLHYSSRYAVTRKGIQRILEEYISRSRESFGVADYGFILNEREQRRRYIIKSLFRSEGLDLEAYLNLFNTNAPDDFAELKELPELGLAGKNDSIFSLTRKGLAYSDAIGYRMMSDLVKKKMEGYLFH